MGPGIRRYFVPLAALAVTFVAGGTLFFVIVAVNPGGDEGNDVTTAPPIVTPVATATTLVTSTLVPGTSTAPPPSSLGPALTRTAEPRPSTTATPAPLANFAGNWRIVDTVVQGRGAGQTYAFFVTISQTGSALQGGAAGAISLSGTVAANVATVEFTQPTIGVTGIFIWTLNADGNASGTFTSSIPNSGTSQLIRLR